VKVLEALGASGLGMREARLLLAAASGLTAAALVARPERELAPEAAARFEGWARRRRSGEPVAYILGRREFYDLDLEVGPQVLIPRPETELLVELALERIAQGIAARVADLGTGSGAVALALKRHRPHAQVVGVENSPAALELARRNAARFGLEVELRRGRWYEPLRSERFDLIVANPPYVAEGDPHLDEGDLRFEPREALVSGADGLDAIREIIAGASAHLLPGGGLLIEHGIGQDIAVQALLESAGLKDASSWRDAAGIVRVSGARVDLAGAAN
jgi:release factor glutamine methyltransferase